MKLSTNRSHTLTIVVAILAAMAGCQSTTPKLSWNSLTQPFEAKKASKDDEAIGTPVRMAVIWKDAIMSRPGNKPKRGFGGRVYFYDEHDEAIRVDGDFTVYAFDDSGKDTRTPPTTVVPDRKYVFRSNELDQRCTDQSAMGPSYSVWIPWDEVGGVRKTITLLPTFANSDGQIVKAGQAIAVLPGISPDKVADRDPLSSQPEQHQTYPGSQVSHLEAATQFARRKATTIRVPKSMNERINQRFAAMSATSQPLQTAVTKRMITESEGEKNTAEERASTNVEATVSTAAESTPRVRPVFGQPGRLR